MTKALGGTGIFTSILLGAIVWFVLQVLIGVVVWVSIVAGGAVALAGVMVALGAFGGRAVTKRHRQHDSMLGAH